MKKIGTYRPHEFVRPDRLTGGHADRKCEVCGFGDDNPVHAKKITITRVKLYPSPIRTYRSQWKWIYSYGVDDGPETSYGTSLPSLRHRLRTQYPDHRIVCDWETSS